MAPTWAYAAALVGTLLLVHVLTKDSLSVEKRWLQALGGAGLGVGEWVLGRDEGRTSPQWHQLSGDATASLSAWLARVHDDDRAELQQALERLRSGAQSRAQRELRIQADDGWRWLDVQLLVAERDHHGQAARLIATLSDSSERHDAQERQRLSSSLFQHLHEGLLIADADLRVLDVNPAYTQILGATRQELLGSVPSMLRPVAARPAGAPAAAADVVQPAQHRPLARRGGGTPPQRRGLHAAGHHLHRQRRRSGARCATTCSSSPTSPNSASSATGSNARRTSTS